MTHAAAVVLFSGSSPTRSSAGPTSARGFWDLTAGGADAAVRAPRWSSTTRSAPVWEANHVWLIFILVVLWTGFPEAFASIMLTLFVPLTLAVFGIVLRGVGFAFRKAVTPSPQRRTSAPSSPRSSVSRRSAGCGGRRRRLGPCARRRRRRRPGDSWMNPTSILGGVLAVVRVAYLAAVYLVCDAHRLADADMVEYFRRRAVIAAVAAGVVAFVGIFVLRADADYLFDGLTVAALPLVVLSALCGVGSLVLLVRANHAGPGAGDRRGGHGDRGLGGGPVAVHPPRDRSRSRMRRHRRGRSRR